MRRTLPLFLLLALALSGCSGSPETVKIGFIGPLTGDAVSYGKDALNAARRAVDEANVEGGIDGKLVDLVVEDGRCTASAAADAARKLVSADGVVAIIGGNCSTETLAAAPIAEEAGVPLLSPISSSRAVTEAGDFVFRLYPSTGVTGNAYARYLSDRGFRSIALLSEETDYCRSLRASITEFLPEGARLVFDETVSAGEKDFRSVLTRLADRQIDVFLIAMQSDAAVAAAALQAKELGIEAPIVANDVADSTTIDDVMGSAIAGMQVLSPVTPDAGRPEVAAFIDAYRRSYGEETSSIYYAGFAYDATNILLRAVAEAGTDGAAIRDWLYALPSYRGVMGDIAFDEKGDAHGVPYGLKEWASDGTQRQIELLPLE